MTEYITILGTEDITRAGCNMISAATDISRAAALIDESLQRHRIFLDEWLARFENLLSEKKDNI